MDHERDPGAGIMPVRPEEIVETKMQTMPSEVIETVNRLIAENIVNSTAVLKQKEVVAALLEAGLDRGEIYRRGWLDFEPIYIQAGWEVEYDKPGYNENYEAFFRFRIPHRR